MMRGYEKNVKKPKRIVINTLECPVIVTRPQADTVRHLLYSSSASIWHYFTISEKKQHQDQISLKIICKKSGRLNLLNKLENLLKK